MGVKVVSRKYFNQYSESASETNWLLGNVGDWQQLLLDIEAEIIYQGTAQSPLQINYVENTFVLVDGSNWGELGFDIGMSIIFKYDLNQDNDNNGESDATSTKQTTYTIKNIQSDVMFIEESIEADNFELLPISYGTRSVSNVFITGQKDVEGIRFSYTHLLNSNYETETLNSVIDGSQTVFSLPNISSVNVGDWQNMLPVGNQSGMAIESCEVRKVDTLVNDNDVFLQMSIPDSTYTLSSEQVAGDDNDFDYKTIPVSFTNTGDYQSVTTARDISLSIAGIPTIQQSDCFIYDASSSYSQDLLFDMIFKIIGTTETADDDFVTIELLRCSGGSNLTYAESINIQTWLDARSNLGIEQNVTALKTIDVNEGDSFVLVVKFRAPSGDFIGYEFLNSEIKISNINSVFRKEGVQFFQVRVNYMISPFFDSPNNFDPLVSPSFSLNNESLTDNFDIKLFPVWNNPNVVIKNDLKQTKRLGNTGWFNENFNGLKNDFNIESVIYKDDDGNVVESLDYSKPINVEVVISGVENLTNDSEFGFGFSWIPQDDDDYYNKKTPYHENLFVSTGRKYTDGLNDSFNLNENTGTTLFQGETTGVGSMDIQADGNVFFEVINSDQVSMKARFVPSLLFTETFDLKNDTDRNYILWISCANQTLDVNFTNRVSLLADYNQLIKTIADAGEYEGMTNAFLEHPQSEDEVGVQNYVGFLEDDILSKVSFSVDTQDQKIISSMSFGYEVLNTTTGEPYELERYSVNLSNFPVNGTGVQEFNIDNIRGFKLETGNNKNWVKIERDTDNDVDTLKYYKAFFGTKIRWEDWLLRDGVPEDFFDISLENNGYNNNWLDYLRSGDNNNYKVNFFVYTELTENEEYKLHKNTFEIDFCGYDENENITTEHNYYRDSDDTLLNVGTDPETGNALGVLLQNEPTRVEIIYTNLVEDFNVSELYAVTTIEIGEGAGEFEHRQLSSVWGSESDNILIPLIGENKLKVEQVSPRVIKTSCLVDNTRLTNTLRYKITGRIGCSNNNDIEVGIYESAYESAYE